VVARPASERPRPSDIVRVGSVGSIEADTWPPTAGTLALAGVSFSE
jgi:hypothetical protein